MKKTIIIIIIFVVIVAFYFYNTIFAFVIGINYSWDVNIPIQNEIVYKVSDVGFGDWTDYRVLKYNNKKAIDKIENMDWTSSKNDEVEQEALHIIEMLKVKDEYIIDFSKEYKYIYKTRKHDDSIKAIDDLIMFYNNEDNIIYIIESVM